MISMIRTKNADAGIIKRITSGAFYKVLNLMSPVKFENNSSDFFAISKNVAGVLRKDYREKIRYLRGYVQSVGFRKTTLEFEAQKREAGESKYSIRKLLHFSINALCSFSDLPLKLGMYSGVFVALCGFILMIFTIINKIVNGAPAGYSTIIVVLCFMFAVVLMVIGIIGEYIAVLFAEIKDRPIYIVRDIYQEEKETEEDSDTDGEETSDSSDSDESEDASSDDETVESAEDTDAEEEAEPEMVDAQLVIKVGNVADDGNRYVMVNDSNEVYTMSEDTLSALTDKSEEDFWDMTVSYVSVNNLATLKMNYQGEDHKVNVSRETSEDEDGNETETVTYKLDGTEIDSTTFTTFYNKLINMAAQKRLTDKFEPEGDPELTAAMTEEDGDSLEVKYYSYDTNYYAAVVDEKVYLVNKMNLKELFTALDTLVASEDESADEQETTDSDSEDTEEQTSEDTTEVEESSSEEADSSTEDDSSETTDNAETDTEEAVE